MIAWIRSSGTLLRTMLGALFACALLLRIGVPAGWMPVHDAAGFRIVICTGTGPIDAAMPMHAMPNHAGKHAPSDHDQHRAEHPCAFAGLAAAVDHPGFVGTIAPGVALAAAVSARPLAVAIGQGLAAPPPPPTGPPLRA